MSVTLRDRREQLEQRLITALLRAEKELTQVLPERQVIPAPTPVTVSPSVSSAPTEISEERHFQDIAAVAYRYWQARGCPDGSPEEDWFKAEYELRCRS
jgi:hypothetical protein